MDAEARPRDDRRSNGSGAAPVAAPRRAERAAAFDLVGEGLVLLDEQGCVVDVNAAAERLMDRGRDALLGMPIWDTYPEAVGGAFHAAAARAAESGETVAVEARFPADGPWFAAAIVPGAGGYTIVFRDVTVARETDEALRESERRLRQAMAAGGLGAWRFDLRTGVATGGERTWEIFGRSRGESTTLDAWSEAIHPDDRERVVAAFARAAAGDGPFEAEYRVRRHDNQVRWVGVVGSMTRGEDGAPVSIDGTIADITDRKLAEERLRALQQITSRLLAAATPEAVAGVILREGMRAAGAVASALYLRRDDALVLAGIEGHDPGMAERYARIPLAADIPAAEAARTGDPGWYPNLAARAARYPHLTAAFAAQRHEASAYLPVRADGATFGALGLAFAEPRAFDPAERAFIQALADQAAQAFARADLYDRLHLANERFSRAEDAAGAFSYEWNVGTGRVERSAGLRGVLGYEPDDIGPAWEDWAALVHPDDLRIGRDEAVALLATSPESRFGNEYRVRHKDGSWRWLQDRVLRVRDPAGAIRGIVGQSIDVTERKRIEAALREREHFLERVTTATPSVIYVFDLVADRTVYANRRLGEVLGYTPEEAQALGDRFLPALIHPDDWAATPAYIDRLVHLGDDEVLEREYRVRHKDGAWRWLLGRETVFARDGGGRAIQVLGSALDVTDRRRVEDALRESEARFREMADSSPFMIWVTDDEANIQFVNRAYREFFGVTGEQVAGPNWVPLVHPDDADDYVASFRAALRDRQPWNREVRVRRADGAWRWIESRSTPRFSPAGDYLGAVGSSPDVTERKDAADRLRASEARLAAVLAQLPVGVGLTDVDGRWLLSNAMLRRYVGDAIPSRDPAGRARWRAWDDRGQPIEPAYWPGARALRGEVVAGMDFLHAADDGTETWTRVSAAPFRDEAGAIVGTVAAIEDIDARKQAETITRFLADAGAVLAGSLDEDETLRLVARLATPALADHCVVDLLDGHRARPAVAVAASDPEWEGVIRDLRRRFPPDPSNPHSVVGAAIRAGEPQLIERLTDEQMERIAGGPPLTDGERAVVARSILVAPLVARDRVLGAMSFGARDPGRYGPNDLRWAAELGRRCALAIDNARLYAARTRAEQQMRLIADALPVLVAYVDRDGRYRFNNRAYQVWFGREPGEFFGQHVAAGVGPAAYALIAPHVEAALAGRRATYTLDVPYADGGPRYVEATYVPDVAPDGTARGYVSLVADVSQRVEAERRERGRAERMGVLAEVSRDLAAARLDLPATLAAVAERAVAVLGDGCVVRLGGGAGSAADGVLDPVAIGHRNAEAAAELRRLVDDVPLRADEGWTGRVAASRQSLLIPVVDRAALAEAKPAFLPYAERFGMGSVAIAPLVADGRVLGTVMVWRDEAARPYTNEDEAFLQALADRAALAIENARLFRESRDAESRVRRLFDAGVVGLLVADPESILEANDRFLAMVGYTREDLDAGRLDWRAMTPPEFLPLDERAMAELVASGACTPFEKEYFRRDGSRLPILIGAAVLDAAPPRWLCFVLDLSDQKALERLQRDFLATVSHDLKGPITAILGQAQLLQRRLARAEGGGDPRTVDGLGNIVEAADRMTAMVDELVDVAQLRAGQALSLDLGPVDLVALAESSAAELRATAPGHVVRVAAAARPLARGDARRLRRVVDNLVGNAIKFSPAGGEVLIAVRREVDAGGAWAALEVRDEGVGIAAADLPRVFERFHRGHNADVARGSGIGLSGARQIVEQHGGTIAAASEPGRGSAFTVRLPL